METQENKTGGEDLRWLQVFGVLDRLRDATREMDGVLRALREVREGGPLARGVAVVSVVGHLAEALLPDTDVSSLLEREGWTPVADKPMVQTLLLSLLKERCAFRTLKLPQRSGRSGAASELLLWERDGVPVVAATKDWESWELVECAPGVAAELLSGIWQQGSAWVVGEESTSNWQLALSPLAEVRDAPIGRVADDLRAWVSQGTGATRIALIVGPTGAGKTSLARTALGRARTLQFPARLRFEDAAVELAKVLRPDVVLLDDIVLGRGGLDQSLAGLLDRLQGKVPLVIATFMDDALTAKDANRPGGLYWPGMRAGRLDRVVFLPPPDLDERARILGYYGVPLPRVQPLAQLTQGLTGAFVREVARRRLADPTLSDEDLVKGIRAQAPEAFSLHLVKEEEEEEAA